MPFHTIITLSYLIPGLYIFIRAWQLFIPRGYRLHYLIIFALVFTVYPVSRNIENSDWRFAGIFETLSGYLIAFLLYLFISILITDIFLLINLIFRVISIERLKQWKFRSRYFLSIILISLVTVIGGIINFNTIAISGYSITVEAGRSELKELKIAFVSDFHLERTVPHHFVERFVKKLKTVDPDIVLYGGDILEGRGEDIHDFEEMLGSIHPRFGTYAVRGNHDRIVNFDNNFFTRAGITLLRDSVIQINNNFSIAGRDEAGNHNRLSAVEIASLAADSLPLIMLDHRPTEPDQISSTKTDIAFSGHTHNGQLFPINLYLHKVYKLSHGYMKKGRTHFFVSSGIRLWGPRVRTTGKSEIVLVNVVFTR